MTTAAAKILNRQSLSQTLDRLNDAFFQNRRLPAKERQELALWLAGRQALPGSYSGLIAPTPRDFQTGVVLFTGEKIKTRAGISHILGQEAGRALRLLAVEHQDVQPAIARAEAEILVRLRESCDSSRGMYCCGTCSVSLWRHLAAGGLQALRPEKFLQNAMKTLHGLRRPDFTWKRFPFYYTLLALMEIDTPAARQELRFALPRIQRWLRRARGDTPIERRRSDLLRRGMELAG